jgi:hypothetical protein
MQYKKNNKIIKLVFNDKLAKSEANRTDPIIIELSPKIALNPADFAYSLKRSKTLFFPKGTPVKRA